MNHYKSFYISRQLLLMHLYSIIQFLFRLYENNMLYIKYSINTLIIINTLKIKFRFLFLGSF